MTITCGIDEMPLTKSRLYSHVCISMIFIVDEIPLYEETH